MEKVNFYEVSSENTCRWFQTLRIGYKSDDLLTETRYYYSFKNVLAL